MRIKPAIALFLACILAIPAMVWPSPTIPHYIQHLQQSHGKNYAFNCLFIDITQVIRGLGLLMYYRTTHRKKNLDQAINVIQNQLKEFETWLLHEEQNALIEIKNKFNINNKIWNACLRDMQELKNVYTKGMQQAHPEVSHDTSIPTTLLNIITKMLSNNNINPQSISIKIVDVPNESVQNKSIARQMRVRLRVEKSINETHNELIFYKRYLSPTIEISSNIKSSISKEKTIAFYAHEIQHLIQHHALTDIVITEYLKHYCLIDDATLAASPEYQKLVQIHEAQAEVLSAIKNPEIAHCLKKYRRCTYYPQHLYEEHYYNISTIDMLWKLDEWLTKWQQFSIVNTTQDILTKMHNVAHSFKELITTT